MGNILILGAGEMQIPIIQKTKELGYNAIVADIDINACGIQFADYFVNISTDDFDSLLNIAKEYKVSGILTTSDFPTKIVSQLCENLSLPSMSYVASSICTDKFKQRTLLKEHGFNVPNYSLYDFSDNFNFENNCVSILENFDFPFILKPIDSSASRGVNLVRSNNEFLSKIKETISFARSNKIICEDYISGREFSVESITQYENTTVLAITEKHLLGLDYGCFVENAHIQPARLSINEVSSVTQTIKRVISAIGINNAPSHIEIKINEKGIYVIEAACRLGGDYITSDLVPLSTGYDMLASLVSITVGDKVVDFQSIDKCSAVQFINTNNYFKCNEFISNGHKSIIRFDLKPFNNKQIRNSLDRLGYIIVQCDSISDVESIINEINN